ncbi:MAG: hypothetical protein ABI972_25265 [Acidobacteriota bacterium]
MAQLRISWRLAKWWQCAIVVVVMSGFGWVLSQGRQSASLTNRRSSHILTPLYGVLAYASLAMLLNKRSVVATSEYFRRVNGPIWVRPSVKIPRNQIACVYYHVISVPSEDSGAPVPIDYLTGIETKDGEQIHTFLDHKSKEDAIASSAEIARSLNEGQMDAPIRVRELMVGRDSRAEKRLAVIRLSICVAALIAGGAWWILGRR